MMASRSWSGGHGRGSGLGHGHLLLLLHLLLLVAVILAVGSVGAADFGPFDEPLSSQPTAPAVDCDASKSHEVREYVASVLKPFMDYFEVSFSGECPLDPARDLYAVHYARTHAGQHGASAKCGVCGKEFISRDYLSAHMHARHPSLIHFDDDGPRCLGDYHSTLLLDLANLKGESLASAARECRAHPGTVGGPGNSDNGGTGEQLLDERYRACRHLLRGCFEASGTSESEDASTNTVDHIEEFLARKACSKATCAYIDQKHRDAASGVWTALSYVGTIFFAMVVVFGYIMFCANSMSGDEADLHAFNNMPGQRVRKQKAQLTPDDMARDGTSLPNITDEVSYWIRNSQSPAIRAAIRAFTLLQRKRETV